MMKREAAAPREQYGMAVIGQFRGLDRPDHFVWFSVRSAAAVAG
jgi:hypothetical protein